MEAKVGVLYFLKNFTVELNQEVQLTMINLITYGPLKDKLVRLAKNLPEAGNFCWIKRKNNFNYDSNYI
jgi:hypothetical protein